MVNWIGKNNREINTGPLLEFRESLQSMGLLLLAYAATSPEGPVPRVRVAAALSELGWRHRDRRPLEGYEIYRLNVFNTLVNVTDRPVTRGDRDWISPAAAALARTALRQ
jgi:hypothetical protein